MKNRWILFFVVCLNFFSLPILAAPEQILGFFSRITVNTDASIDVQEQISVYANNEKIIHGIVRRLPTRYSDSYGIKHHTAYQIKDVIVNDVKSAYHLQNNSNELAVYIGDNTYTLPPGIYVYTITYHVNDAVNFLKDADELYWNITGNRWDFPIAKAQADIVLPQGATIGLYSGYTGVVGAKEQFYTANKRSPNSITFDATKTLQPGQGFTIAVAWQKGIVTPPSFMQRLKNQTNSIEMLLFVILIGLIIYYLTVWFFYGKDPHQGTIVPLFEPPAGLTPGATRFIYNMGYDDKCFTAAVVDMGVKGAVTIKNDNDDFKLTKNTDGMSKLTGEEKILADKLFYRDVVLDVDNNNANTFRQAISSYKNQLKNLYQKSNFSYNTIYTIPGILLMFIAMGFTILAANDKMVASFLFVWLTIWTIACLGLLLKWVDTFKLLFNQFNLQNLFSFIFISIFTLPFWVAEVVVLTILSTILPVMTVPLIVLMGVMNWIFSWLMRVPTVAGRKLMDQIEGFKMYLGATEKNRLNVLNPPNQSIALYERFLPYAIALDVENAWGENFNHFIQQAGIKPETYHPTWYQGTWNSNTPVMLPLILGTSLNSSISTSSISSSSSASGGGGSSGGGGGGGGGGGW